MAGSTVRRMSAAWARCAAAVTLLTGADALAVNAAPFPDEWFYDGASRPAELKSLEGDEAPEISIAKWIGDETSLEDLRGEVVVLDFWATWCGPCMAAIPKNIELVEKYGDEGMTFIGIHDAASGWNKADGVVRSKKINYTVGLDATQGQSGKSTKAYNLQFWPTYVVIDRSGVVRGAGLLPNRVEDAVKKLLAEPWEGGDSKDAAAGGSEFPDAWYYGAEDRPASLRAAEGAEAPAIVELETWIGDAPTARAMDRRVAVVQFVRPELRLSLRQMDGVLAMAERYGKQGVTFVVICDARSDWAAMEAAASERDLAIPVGHDAPDAEGDDPRGRIAEALGVRYGPTTVVVDRAGVVRAAGLRSEHLPTVLNALLAEPMPMRGSTTKESDSKGG